MSRPFKGRREDARLVTGQGRYSADWSFPGQLHACFLRSDRAHAEIVALDVKHALAFPGVVAVLTGKDTTEAGFKTAEYLFWGGLAFPAKTPRAIVDKLHAETTKALALPAVQEKLAKLGVVPHPLSVDAFGKFYRDYIAETVQLGKDINLVPTN